MLKYITDISLGLFEVPAGFPGKRVTLPIPNTKHLTKEWLRNQQAGRLVHNLGLPVMLEFDPRDPSAPNAVYDKIRIPPDGLEMPEAEATMTLESLVAFELPRARSHSKLSLVAYTEPVSAIDLYAIADIHWRVADGNDPGVEAKKFADTIPMSDEMFTGIHERMEEALTDALTDVLTRRSDYELRGISFDPLIIEPGRKYQIDLTLHIDQMPDLPISLKIELKRRDCWDLSPFFRTGPGPLWEDLPTRDIEWAALVWLDRRFCLVQQVVEAEKRLQDILDSVIGKGE